MLCTKYVFFLVNCLKYDIVLLLFIVVFVVVVGGGCGGGGGVQNTPNFKLIK